MKDSKRVLIIEDDLLSAEYIKSILQKNGYDVVGIVDKGVEGVKEAKTLKPDLVLMDIMLKDSLSGCEAAVEINQFDSSIKIVFLTAHTEQEMIDYAIDSQALAYLVKPYREDEILATLKLIFAQQKDFKSQRVYDTDEIEIQNGYIFDAKLKRLFKDNKEVSLGKKPLKLIEILAKNKNVSVSNEQICYHIWGEIKNDKTLRSLIYRIRATLQSDFIKNINGLGYKIA